MKRLEQQLRSLLGSRASTPAAAAAAASSGGGSFGRAEEEALTTPTTDGADAAATQRPLQSTRSISAAPTEGTAFENASNAGEDDERNNPSSSSDSSIGGEEEEEGSVGGESSRATAERRKEKKKEATSAAVATATAAGDEQREAGADAKEKKKNDAPLPPGSSPATDDDAKATTAATTTQAQPAAPRAPASFYCPISMELMADPVVVATGHTYDRRCIERWLSAGHNTCPATGARLRHLELTPNFALRDAVAEWALREGVAVPQPEDGAGRTAAALLYKGGGGVGGGTAGEELGGSARGSDGGSVGGGGGAATAAATRRRRRALSSSRASATAEAEAVVEAASVEATAATTEAAPLPPRDHQRQQVNAATTSSSEGEEAEANVSSDPLPFLAPPTILRGHDEIVWAVEAANGRLFSASADRSVRVWDVSSRRCEAVLEDHARPVLCLALAPASDALVGGGRGENDDVDEDDDDDLLFSGSYDFTVKCWSLRTLSRVKTLTGHADAVRSLLYVPPTAKESTSRSPLGRRGRLFSASYDGTVRVWDVATLQPVATLPGHSGPVRTLASVDGLVFSGSYDKTIRAWHVDSLNPAACLTGHTSAVRALVAVDRSGIGSSSPLGPLLFSGSDDGTVRAWCPRTLSCVATLRGHEDNVRVLAAATDTGSSPPTPPLLFSGSWDRTVRAWCLRTLRCVRVLRGHGEAVLALAVGKRCVASGSYDASVRLWDLDGIVSGGEGSGVGGTNDADDENDAPSTPVAAPPPPPSSRACAGHDDAVRVLTADGEGHVFSGSYDGSVGIWLE